MIGFSFMLTFDSVASLAAMRKSNEAAQPRRAMHTPQEFSRLKYERDCKMQDSAKAFRQSVFQQQRVTFITYERSKKLR